MQSFLVVMIHLRGELETLEISVTRMWCGLFPLHHIITYCRHVCITHHQLSDRHKKEPPGYASRVHMPGGSITACSALSLKLFTRTWDSSNFRTGANGVAGGVRSCHDGSSKARHGDGSADRQSRSKSEPELQPRLLK